MNLLLPENGISTFPFLRRRWTSGRERRFVGTSGTTCGRGIKKSTSQGLSQGDECFRFTVPTLDGENMDINDPGLALVDKTTDGILRFSHHAMATVFEVLMHGEDPVYARQAAHEAFQEVDRLEQELSRYIPNSDISCINALAPSGKMLLSPEAFDCLNLALQYSAETNGAF